MADPLCCYFRKCGGCSAQHINYSTQLENKKKLLINRIKYEDVKIFFDNNYNYRNRMDFIFHRNGLGLREKGKWYSIIDIEKCVISNEKLNLLLREIREFFNDCDYFDIRKKTGTFKYAVLRTPGDNSSISFVLNENSTRLNEAIKKIKEFAKISCANNIIVTYVPANSDISISNNYFVVKGTEKLKETLLDSEFYYSIQGFFQNNTVMTNKMHEYIHKILEKYKEDTLKSSLLDLYGGVGTFGIINAGLFKSVIIVENDKNCIDSVEENIKNNNVKNIKAIILDAKQLGRLKLKQPLFVITDPPRSGMDEKTIIELKKLKPKVIIYISCNVDRLGKDIPKFKDYKIKSAAMFDLFPQTPHIEAVVEMELNTQS
ncbi:MAG: 23S rRNA (uracil(1939)-C(5))-methyltransferase RlmD [Candidatus Woesearchaeota archaeon]